MRVAPLVGGRPGAVVAHADITERTLAVKACDAEARFRSLVERSIAGIFIIQNGALAYANPRFAEILSHGEPEELLGRDLLSLIVTTDRDRVGERIAMLLRGSRTSQRRVRRAGRDGTVVMLGVNGSLAGYLGAPAIIGMMRDIRDKKAVEDEIRRYVDQLQNAFMQTVEVATTLSELRDPIPRGMSAGWRRWRWRLPPILALTRGGRNRLRWPAICTTSARSPFRPRFLPSPASSVLPNSRSSRAMFAPATTC